MSSIFPITKMFQSTHPRGVRRHATRPPTALCCFNPRTHEGCDKTLHIPLPCALTVSIHAPTRGATLSSSRIASLICSFNPRTHEGCDGRFFLCVARYDVSIHAPTRGATMGVALVCDALEFQSTHPRGVRPPGPSLTAALPLCFNPRTHEGCDSYSLVESYFSIVSIHAPTRGATFMLVPLVVVSLFQSTHPRGVRLADLVLLAVSDVSIHAPTRGATPSRW